MTKLEYFKARCEAAEKVIQYNNEFNIQYIEAYKIWQSLVSTPEPDEPDEPELPSDKKIIRKARRKYHNTDPRYEAVIEMAKWIREQLQQKTVK